MKQFVEGEGFAYLGRSYRLTAYNRRRSQGRRSPRTRPLPTSPPKKPSQRSRPRRRQDVAPPGQVGIAHRLVPGRVISTVDPKCRQVARGERSATRPCLRRARHRAHHRLGAHHSVTHQTPKSAPPGRRTHSLAQRHRHHRGHSSDTTDTTDTDTGSDTTDPPTGLRHHRHHRHHRHRQAPTPPTLPTPTQAPTPPSLLQAPYHRRHPTAPTPTPSDTGSEADTADTDFGCVIADTDTVDTDTGSDTGHSPLLTVGAEGFLVLADPANASTRRSTRSER